MTRTARCVRRITQNWTEVVEMELCPGTEPGTRKICSEQNCPPHWAMDGWTEVCMTLINTEIQHVISLGGYASSNQTLHVEMLNFALISKFF